MTAPRDGASFPFALRPLIGAIAARFALVAGSASLAALFVRRWAGRDPFVDEGSVDTIAREILRGLVPYRDIVNEKLPGHYLLTAGWMSVFGTGFDSGRWLAGVLVFLSAILAVVASWRWGGSKWASLLAPVAIVAVGGRFRAHVNLAEAALAPLMLLLAMVITDGIEAEGPDSNGLSRRRAVLGGALAGLAFLFKQQYAIVLAGVLVAAFVRPRGGDTDGKRPGNGFQELSGILAGFAATAFAGLALLAIWSGPAPLWRATVGNFLSTGGAGYGRQIPASSLAVLGGLGILVAALALVSRPRSFFRPLVALFASLLLCAFPRGDLFRAWPAVVVAVSLVLAVLLPDRTPPEGEPAPVLSFGRTLAPMLAGLIVVAAAFLELSMPLSPDPLMVAYRDVAMKIRTLSAPGDPIWVGPHAAPLYAIADRKPASRHIFLLPWVAGAQARAELLEDFRHNRPELIVDVSSWNPRIPPLRTFVPEIGPLLDVSYEPVSEISGVRLFRRRK